MGNRAWAWGVGRRGSLGANARSGPEPQPWALGELRDDMV